MTELLRQFGSPKDGVIVGLMVVIALFGLWGVWRRRQAARQSPEPGSPEQNGG